MLTYELDRRGNLPAYEFLYRSIRDDILSGKLAAGEKLPPKRGLAEHLGVSVTTVENAYAQLLLEGYLRAEERRGYFVCALEGGPLPAEFPPQPGPAPEKPEQDWFADLKTNRPPQSQFPFSVWARLMREALTERDPALLAPMPGRGLLPLREAIAAYLGRFRGMSVSPSQIVIGAGTEFLYGLVVRLLGRDKRYAVEDPGYPRILQAYRASGADCVPVPLEENGLSVRGLREAGAQAAHLSPAHQFPTGRVTPASRRRELLSWVEEEPDRYLIEDDYDSEFRYAGRPIPTLQSVDRTGRVLYLNTFSETLTPAIRISYLVLSPALSARFSEDLEASSCTVSSFEQVTLAKFISRGFFESHLARTRHFYRRRRDAMITAIRESPLGPRSRIREAGAGLHFLLETDSPYPDGELVRRARERGINISCLSQYYSGAGKGRPGCFIITYSGMREDRMEETARRLAEAAFG